MDRKWKENGQKIYRKCIENGYKLNLEIYKVMGRKQIENVQIIPGNL